MSTSKARSYVWIGYLKEPTDENALRHHFKSFGPIRNVEISKDKSGRVIGLIHYHNDEVAEVAAKEMNGKIICGKKVQTKGPKNHSSSSSFVATEITDCYYYILNGFCKPKQGQKCLYRHIKELRNTKIVCEKWPSRQCTNRTCPKLHPSAKSEAEALKKVPLERCKSHNAFKCYGDCGKENCNTHFQTEKDLEEHILQKRRDPLEKCPQCNAVFFDVNEKLFHHHKKPNKSKKDASNTSTVEKSRAEPIGVFWDIENCQVPKGKSALAVVQNIRETFYPGRREVEFMCVCDTTKEKKDILEELNKSQINIIHINATSKNAADDKLKQSLRRFAQTHKPPATIVLISGDINFASELSDLRHRHNLRVILIHNQQASTALRHCANESHNFEQFTVGLPTMKTPVEDPAKEIIVTNLPAGTRQTMNKVRNQLKILSGNTGGKVFSVLMSDDESKGSTAVIRFADAESARKALTRLNNEEVLGSRIKVALKNQAKQPTSQPVGNKEIHARKNSQPSGVHTNLNKSGKSKSMMTLAHQNFADNLRNNYQNDNQKHKIMKPFSPSNPNSESGSLNYLNIRQQTPPMFMNHPSSMEINNGMFHPPRHNMPPLYPSLMAPFSSLTTLHTNTPLGARMPMIPSNLPPPTPLMQQNAGVNLLITNLDAAIHVAQLKQELVALVREHSKVMSVSFADNKKSKKIQALVEVPKMQDAQLCIAKLNNHKLFSRNIKVSLAATKEHAVLKMKEEVSSLLQDVSTRWLPLNEFLLMYKERYNKALYVLDLDRIKDVVYVDGKAGNQFICLLHFNIGSVKLKQETNFSGMVLKILQIHNRKVPFTSLLGLYWSYTGQKLPIDESGEVLVKLKLNQGICFVGSTPENMIIFYKKPKPTKGKKYPLEDLERDIIQLLIVSPLFIVPFNKLASLYQQFFGRQLCVASYGYKELGDLLKALPEVIEVTEQKDGKNVSFTSTYKQVLLNKVLTELLTGREKHKLLLNSLLTAYYRYYGHKLYYRNYGYSSLLEMISSLDRKFKTSGTGDAKVLALSPERKKPSQKVLKKFAEEIANLIQSKPDKQLGFHNLSSEFYKYYKKQLKLSDFGFTKLNDLVAAISDFVEIRGSRDQKILYMSDDHPDFENLWEEVDWLVRMSPEQCILGLQLPEIYQTSLSKPFPLDSVKMSQFLKRSSRNTLVIGKGPHQIVMDDNKDKYPSKLLNEQLAQLTYYKFEHFQGPIGTLHSMLEEKGIHVSMERLNLEVNGCDFFQLTKEDNFVHLLPVKSHKLFEYDVIRILYDEPDHKLLLNHFAKSYTKKFRRVMRIADYGVNKLMHLFDKITKDFVKVDHPPGGGQPTVSLGRLGKLCMECDHVMDENAGSLLLCNFAPEYQRKFGIQLRPNEYGFSKILELAECFDCVFEIFGEKNMKVVVQRDRILNPQLVDAEFVSATDSGSESDSDVVVESEELEVKDEVELQETDLLRFHPIDDGEEEEEEDHQSHKISCEWWMDPIPNLPEPALQPEQSSSGGAMGFDLISFKEFEDEDIRSGGIDNSALPPPLIPNTTSLYSSVKHRTKSSSDDFVDHLFSSDIIPEPPLQQKPEEPDLMRMLVGRCSPVDPYLMQSVLGTNERQSSTTTGSISDTYSCFSALSEGHAKEVGSSHAKALNDLHIGHRTLRPTIAANFNKM